MSRVQRIFFILLLLLASSFYRSALAQSPAACWKLHMETAIGGRYDLLVSSTALRIDSKSFHYTIIANAPQWNLTIWRNDTREICHCSSAQYLAMRRNAVNTTSSCNLEKLVNKHAIAIPRFGLKGVQYVYAGERRGHDLFISDKTTETVKNYFIDCADIDLPHPVRKLIGATSTLPDLPGLPYQMSEVLESGERYWQVLTHTFQKQKTLSPNAFIVPKNYKDVGAFKHNFLYKSVSTMMDDTVDSIGIGESPLKKKVERK